MSRVVGTIGRKAGNNRNLLYARDEFCTRSVRNKRATYSVIDTRNAYHNTIKIYSVFYTITRIYEIFVIYTRKRVFTPPRKILSFCLSARPLQSVRARLKKLVSPAYDGNSIFFIMRVWCGVHADQKRIEMELRLLKKKKRNFLFFYFHFHYKAVRAREISYFILYSKPLR